MTLLSEKRQIINQQIIQSLFTQCDNITELEYEAMSNLPEDRVAYVCRRCCKDNVWRQEMMQCVQENLAHVRLLVNFS